MLCLWDIHLSQRHKDKQTLDLCPSKSSNENGNLKKHEARRMNAGARKGAQLLRAPTGFPEDLNPILSTHLAAHNCL